MKAARPLLVAVLLVGFFGGQGCKKATLKPGSYELVGVSQVSNKGETFEDRSDLAYAGYARWHFDADGSFIQYLSRYSVAGEKQCTGDVRGQWTKSGDEVTVTFERGTVPARCRQEEQRTYHIINGVDGSIYLELAYVEGLWVVYRLDPLE